MQKILAQWGIASRRRAEQMILDGRVEVNGAIAHLGQKADPACDRIAVDGQPIRPIQRPKPLYLLLHKPRGVISTCADPHGRRTVLDLLPPALQDSTGLHPVGRLDTDSTGALLLTNDGNLTFALTHPSHQIPKHYRVWVEGRPPQAVLRQWRSGIMLEEGLTQPAEVQVLRETETATLLAIDLREGRNRQIRRVAEQLGHPVQSLHRMAIGPIHLGNLALGQYRPLTDLELDVLQTQAVGFLQGSNRIE